MMQAFPKAVWIIRFERFLQDPVCHFQPQDAQDALVQPLPGQSAVVEGGLNGLRGAFDVADLQQQVTARLQALHGLLSV